MEYVLNPKNGQIIPVNASTFADPVLRNRVISEELAKLVYYGKVSIEDVQAMFAIGKSPEVLVQDHKAIEDSPVRTAPDNTAVVTETISTDNPIKETGVGIEATAKDTEDAIDDIEAIFDGGDLKNKTVVELTVLAKSMGIDISDKKFKASRANLTRLITEKAKAAEHKAEAAGTAEVFAATSLEYEGKSPM